VFIVQINIKSLSVLTGVGMIILFLNNIIFLTDNSFLLKNHKCIYYYKLIENIPPKGCRTR